MDNKSTIPSSNPLMTYSRHPEVYILLPSQGKFNNSTDMDFTATGELAVCAMTTSDDLLLKSPEGLLNGDSLAKVIKSCCPDIKNVHNLTVPDLDAILLAIRQASYGDEMEFDVVCPKCSNEAVFVLQISSALANLTFLDDEYCIKLSNDVQVSLKPFTYEYSIKESMQKYHESLALKQIVEEDITDSERGIKFTKTLTNLSELIIELCAKSIISIIDPAGDEINATNDQIIEWVRSLPNKDGKAIQEQLAKINSTGIDRNQHVTCNKCKHEWTSIVNFDPTHFFAKSS